MKSFPAELTQLRLLFRPLFSNRAWPSVPPRWVLVRDPQRLFQPQAFLCTDQQAAPQHILNWFVKRWQIEVALEEARAPLGMETQRQWSALAMARTTPVILALYSMVTLMARQRLRRNRDHHPTCRLV